MADDSDNKVTFLLRTGELSDLTHFVPVFYFRIPIDPEDAGFYDDKFRLYSTDGTYDETQTVKDDKVDGDEFVDLIFENIKASLNYTLEIDPGDNEEVYKVFEDMPYQELIDQYFYVEDGEFSYDEDEDEDEDEDDEEDESEEDTEDDEEEDDGEEFGGDPDPDDDALEKILMKKYKNI